MKLSCSVLAFCVLAAPLAAQPYLDPDLPPEQRAADLVSRMTLDEKIAQLNYAAPAIERLKVPAYNWWNEALHGVARHGRATVFPQAIGLAATWDPDLIHQVATAISDEGRAKYNASLRFGEGTQYAGLTFWSPNINIYRDPRWGRGQETYGEDPFLTGEIGSAFVRGLQGDHPRYLKAAACAKHYAVHSGPEGDRHHFNVSPPLKDFRETYLPAFKKLVTEAKVEIVMCAYQRLYDEPCCGSPLLLQDILRDEWGFKGHVTSDCWAIADFHMYHKVTENPAESAALAYKSGVDVNCGNTSPYLKEAVEQGLITEEVIDQRLATLMTTRFRLGMFDPPEMVPYNRIGPEVVDSPEHRTLARRAAEKGIVLLKNNGVLPLKKDLSHIFVLGPNAANTDVLLANYFGVNPDLRTILEGITAKVDPGTKLEYAHAFLLDRENINKTDWASGSARIADATIVVMGLSGLLEGEEGESLASPTMSDRFDIRLPQNQVDYLRKVRDQGDKPLIVVLTGGSPVAIPEVEELADALIYAWYPGQEGGNAVANLIFGDVVPSGRLPITFPKSVDQLPPYEEYSMVGRTYRYMDDEPLFPFGFGLSYTTFAYSEPAADKTSISRGESVTVSVKVTNTGQRAAEEVVQCYLTDLEASVRTPRYDLRGFKRVHLWPGETKTVSFTIEPEMMQLVNEQGEHVLEPGGFRLTLGGSSPSPRVADLGGAEPAVIEFRLQ